MCPALYSFVQPHGINTETGPGSHVFPAESGRSIIIIIFTNSIFMTSYNYYGLDCGIGVSMLDGYTSQHLKYFCTDFLQVRNVSTLWNLRSSSEILKERLLEIDSHYRRKNGFFYLEKTFPLATRWQTRKWLHAYKPLCNARSEPASKCRTQNICERMSACARHTRTQN